MSKVKPDNYTDVGIDRSTAINRPENNTQQLKGEALIRSMQDSLKLGLVPINIYNDEEIYRLELERIFLRNWIFLAHESEIPKVGDYVQRSIGQDSFIVVRDNQGKIQVHLDVCRHRGARLCVGDRGNTEVFRCPYHGWTYDMEGNLTGVPNRIQAYQGLKLDEWGLINAPRVESYRGLVFACLDPEIKSLEDYLGDFRWYLDIHLGLSPEGMEVIGDPHRWNVNADWKSGSDNFAGDSYHTQSLHRSILEIGLASKSAAGSGGSPNDIHVTECGGHSTSIRRNDPGSVYYWGYPEELHMTFSKSDLSFEQRELAERSVVHTGTIFPNLSLIHIGGTDDPAKPIAAWFSLRQWQPRGPGKMEAWSWTLVPKEASKEYKQRAHRVAVANFSPSGNFEQDDVVVWAGVARAGRGAYASHIGLHLNFQMGMEGMSQARQMTDWVGPGVVYDSNLEEGVQRTFFNSWLKSMVRQ